MRFQRGLDIGAGNGFITAALQPHFTDPLVTTDVSQWIAWRQWWNGFQAFATDDVTSELLAENGLPGTYNVVLALNVLDSCPDPTSLLINMIDLMEPDGMYSSTHHMIQYMIQ